MKTIAIVLAIIIVILILGVVLFAIRKPKTTPVVNVPPPPAPQYVTYMSAGGSCPANWEDVGQFGVIVDNAAQSPLTKGGVYNNDWTWGHGKLCRGDAATAPSSMYRLYTSPVANSTRIGVLGKTLDNMGMAKGSPAEEYPGYSWYHPYIANVNNPGGYGFVESDDDVDMAGVILSADDLGKTRFRQAGMDYYGWKWVLPKVQKM